MLPLDDRGLAAAGRLKDRYAFEGFLGQGGFAAVYRVRNLRLERVEALKVLFEGRGSDPKFAARFEREARIAAAIEHANVVRVYDFGNADGTLWYSMQYVDGPTLRVRLERHGRMRGEDAAGLLVPLLEALEVVHRNGIVHRDVKPDNIILDADERPYLMDFGIVKRDDNLNETAEGKILGTPAYLSPEQLRGHPLDGRSDLYAAGVTLYQMLTGEIPFRSDDRITMMTRRLTEDPERPSAKVPDLEPELEAIVLKALAREREARYASAAEMRAALSAFLGGSGARTSSGALPRVGPAFPSATLRSVETTSTGTSVLAIPPSTPNEPSSLPSAAPPGPPRPAPVTARSSWLPAAAALVLVAIGGAALLLNRGGESRLPDTNAPSPVPSGLTKVVPADVLEETPVVLPALLAATCAGKTIAITVVIAPDGSLKNSRVVSHAVPECDAAALEAVSRYRFRAGRDERDNPVEGRLTLSVRY